MGDPVATEPPGPLPNVFALEAPYPNPFNRVTKMRYTLAASGSVTISAYELTGRLVRVLFDGTLPAGNHAVDFDATNLPSGVYLVRLSSRDQHRYTHATQVR